MSVKKYELVKDDTVIVEDINECKCTLYRIRALKDLDDNVHKGDLGGYIQSEKNLSQKGNC